MAMETIIVMANTTVTVTAHEQELIVDFVLAVAAGGDAGRGVDVETLVPSSPS